MITAQSSLLTATLPYYTRVLSSQHQKALFGNGQGATCLENMELSAKDLTGVGKCRGVDQKSEKCDGGITENLLREYCC